MGRLSFQTAPDIQQQLADAVKALRKNHKLSRRALAEKSAVPEATIKKFETTGLISLRQFLLLWQAVADLKVFSDLVKDTTTRATQPQPRSIDDILRS